MITSQYYRLNANYQKSNKTLNITEIKQDFYTFIYTNIRLYSNMGLHSMRIDFPITNLSLSAKSYSDMAQEVIRTLNLKGFDAKSKFKHCASNNYNIKNIEVFISWENCNDTLESINQS